jgi:hypothetical protein
MLKRILAATICAAIICAAATAGDIAKPAAAPSMDDMKAAMLKCYVCKHIASQMDAIGPMGMESVKLNDGVALRHWAQSDDPKKIAALHAACAYAGKAGEECMAFSDERAKTDLCEFCQEIRNVAKAGARLSQGDTPNGDIMVLTSSDPAVQVKLASMQQQCAMMAEHMAPPSSKSSAQKE